MEEETTETDNQSGNRPWLWKKGQSGNLKGRPVGKTMKEYAREYLSKMTDDERDEWLDGLNKDIIWRMSEGNPKQDNETEIKGKIIVELSEIIAKKNNVTPSSTE